jgi:hypothetical protein
MRMKKIKALKKYHRIIALAAIITMTSIVLASYHHKFDKPTIEKSDTQCLIPEGCSRRPGIN